MSQSTGWADCIALAMAPIGVITIIVSAIRVAGPRILKAVIGRARENVAAAELEVMSSTSLEACELWNSQTRAVVRCPGTTDNCEFVCIYPKSMQGNTKKEELRVQVMEINKAVAPDDPEVSTDGAHHYLRNVKSKRSTLEGRSRTVEPNTIIITRNPKNKAPNMTLNCVADSDHWQVRACAAIGIIIQAGVLVFFGFLTEYRTLKFDKDGTPIANYAMPMAVIGTLAVSLGILICAYVVDASSQEETYEAINKDSAAVAMVWLQKEKNVSDQHFDSAAIYPTMTRHQACTSQRMDVKEQVKFSIRGQELSSNTLRLEIMATTGTLISLLGFFIQFIGLRGMHWLASIAQLGAVIIMTILRALIRRHLAQGLSNVDLKTLTGFELEWFVTSLLDNEGIKWIPGDRRDSQDTTNDEEVASEDDKLLNKVSQFDWIVRTGASKSRNSLEPSDADASDSPNLLFKEVSDL
ncbi:hypothetical protein IL306_000315 [Fusarium sp. DS 682]|nr:hypothetical protein IL306_000315 [Fusarium sp. DS 682]